jgi:hypothetical protein
MKWIVEQFGQCDNLVGSLQKLGSNYELITPTQDIEQSFNVEECVLYYGSLNRAWEIKTKARWIPGIYCDFDKLKCSYYYPRLHQYLFNQDCIFLPFGIIEEIISKKSMYLDAPYILGIYFYLAFLHLDHSCKNKTSLS